jgi:hypothetical protein
MKKFLIAGHNNNNGKNIFTKEQEAEICRLYKDGKTTRSDIAKRFKCGKLLLGEY